MEESLLKTIGLTKGKPVLTTRPKTIQQKSQKSWLQNKKNHGDF